MDLTRAQIYCAGSHGLRAAISIHWAAERGAITESLPMPPAPPIIRILVNADACPVKDEALRVAERHGLVIVFVANTGLRPSRDPMVRYVMVPQGADAADGAEQGQTGDSGRTVGVSPEWLQQNRVCQGRCSL